MKKLLMGVVALHLAAAPSFADVIPTRRVDRDTASEQKLKARLESMGVSAQDADRQVRDLTPGETSYFARDINRVQQTAGLYWYEWVGGIAVFFIIAVVLFVYGFPEVGNW